MNFIGCNHTIIPGQPFDSDGVRYEYPDTRLVWWAGGDPFYHHQNLNLMKQAWQKPDAIIVNEWCWNPLAKHADIVLPCATPLERDDMAMTPRDPYVVLMSKLTEPYGQARNDYDIFAGIAGVICIEETFTQGRSATDWQRSFKLDDPARSMIMLEDCPGHPVWREPYEWLGNVNAYPLHLISNQPRDKLYSQFDHGGVRRTKKVAGREPLHIHPSDAAESGLKDGDIVRLFNDRGPCLGGVVIDAAMRPGVVQMSTGASKLGQGPSAHSCLIQVKHYTEAPPAVTSYKPPFIIRPDISNDSEVQT